jgi:hypothetical protein
MYSIGGSDRWRKREHCHRTSQDGLSGQEFATRSGIQQINQQIRCLSAACTLHYRITIWNILKSCKESSMLRFGNETFDCPRIHFGYGRQSQSTTRYGNSPAAKRRGLDILQYR